MMDSKVVKELIKARKIVKAKLDALKSEQFSTQENLAQSYLPLMNILPKALLKNEQKKNKVKKEEKEEEEGEPDEATQWQQSLPDEEDIHHDDVKKTIKKTRKRQSTSFGTQTDEQERNIIQQLFPNTSRAEQSFVYHPPQHQPLIPSVEESYFFDDSIQDLNATQHRIPDETLMEYLDQFPDILQQYIVDRMRSTNNDFDTHYFSHDVSTDVMHFGNGRLNFNDDSITVTNPDRNEMKFPLTVGMIELLMKTIPDDNKITSDDKRNFKDLVVFTSAHKKHFMSDEQIVGNRGDKYRYTIKPLVVDVLKKEQEQQDRETLTKLRLPTSASSSKHGSGYGKSAAAATSTTDNNLFMTYNKRPIEYVYWDSPNELVQRLRLLMASQAAGNNSHVNEINSIIEELRENNIIE